MPEKRIQLTLFVDEGQSEIIEYIRRKYNPAQHALIKSHVTLCREDELEQTEAILQTVARLDSPPVTIDFGNMVRFSEGKGLMMPAIGENRSFHELRKRVLKDTTPNPRIHEPHITLMHPRNAACTDDLFRELAKISLPHKLDFTKISLIRQEEGKVWEILDEFSLK